MPYTVVNDAPPTGTIYSQAKFINASGEVAGRGITDSGYTGATWTTTGAVTPLSNFGINWVDIGVEGFNASGEIVGIGSATSGDVEEAALWTSAAAAPIILNDPGNMAFEDVLALNDAGDSVGLAYTTTGDEAVYWNSAGAATVLAGPEGSNSPCVAQCINDLGEIGGFSNNMMATMWSPTGSILWQSPDYGSYIYDINASGASVGYDGSLGSAGKSVYWSPDGTETVLATPPGSGHGDMHAINASGHSVGFVTTASGNEAIQWSRNGTATILHDLRHATSSNVWDINKSDASVGYCVVNGQDIATHWNSAGEARNLQTILGAGWSNTEATGINDAGDICGFGSYDGALYEGFELLWIPKAGSPDNGSYVHAASQSILAASAIHGPVTESAAHGFASVGHGPG